MFAGGHGLPLLHWHRGESLSLRRGLREQAVLSGEHRGQERPPRSLTVRLRDRAGAVSEGSAGDHLVKRRGSGEWEAYNDIVKSLYIYGQSGDISILSKVRIENYENQILLLIIENLCK